MGCIKAEFVMLKSSFGKKIEAGCDEAGRGSLAGPVAAAAVILPDDPLPWFEQVNDSKLLTSRTREKLYKKIIEDAGFATETVEFTSAEAAARYSKGYTGDFYLKLPVYVAQKSIAS